ncbi:MAG: hypothetical protein V7631_1459 [Massilia sp.]|jgi:hypothetical protein
MKASSEATSTPICKVDELQMSPIDAWTGDPSTRSADGCVTYGLMGAQSTVAAHYDHFLSVGVVGGNGNALNSALLWFCICSCI